MILIGNKMKGYRERVQELQKKVEDFPSSPGVYLMKREDKKIIYIGKARKLRARVRSYFSGKKDIKTGNLLQQVHHIDYIVTSSEYEALILENNLIKKWNPRYNIALKDGKSYPVICITQEEYPRIFRTRRIGSDRSHYYGPYPDVKALDETLSLIRKILPLRYCKTLPKDGKPCLYYHIKKCSAPCAGKVSKEEYRVLVHKARSILRGQTAALEKELLKAIRGHSEKLEFEQAAELRDALQALQRLQAEQKVEDSVQESRDYVGLDSSKGYYSFALMQMRGGKLLGKEIFRNEYYGPPEEALEGFLLRYYSSPERDFPQIVYLPSTGDLSLTEEYFHREIQGAEKLHFSLPKEKRDQAILNMALENARMDLALKLKDLGNIPALEDLRDLLNLKKLPRHIEGFDIAHLDGQLTVASLISFKDGAPDRANYRHFSIRSLDGKIDDFKAISEAIARRYTRLKNEKKPLPDLILVDGGKGQVSAAQGVLQALELPIPLVGLAKREELLYLPEQKEALRLPEGDRALRVLQYLRDETHRFATSHNKRLRKRKIALESLENIPGIGPAKSKKLLTSFGSMEKLYSANSQEISQRAGLTLEVAEVVAEYLTRREIP